MANHEKVVDQNGQRAERIGKSCTSRVNEQRTLFKTKQRIDETELPAPPPDPWTNSWRLPGSRDQVDGAQCRNIDEDEDIIAYLTDFGTLPFEGQTSECPSRNSAMSAMAISGLYAEDAFEHLDRLYTFAEQILELRERNSKFFKRVRNLERLKVLRDANHKLESAFMRDKDATINVCDEDTGFAESLLDAMLSNCRDSPLQKRNIRSSSRQARNKLDVEKQTSVDEVSGNGPKVSKWTRVKAAFKWERAYTNDTEIVDSTVTTNTTATTSVSTPLIKYQRIPEVEIRESNSTATSSPVNETCNAGTSSPSSSNEGYYECPQKNTLNYLDYQPLKRKTNKKVEYTNWHNESPDDNIFMLDTIRGNETGTVNEVSQGKPLIRITSEKIHPTLSNRTDEKDTESTSKRSTPTLTIAIPSHEDDIRYTSSPESNSPLFFNANISAGNSPQQRKTYRDLSINKDFKRQRSYGGESVILTSKMQRQDSKWNKVRRAFLTNSTPSCPSSLFNVVTRQILFQDGLEASMNCNYNDSVENIEKTTPLGAQVDTRQSYRSLRERLGTEFQQKLVEWERLKNFPPRTANKDIREVSSSLSSPQENLLSEERLAPEFRKKLQDWKRAKKIRRGSAPFEQQRLNRRRLTDWQLWRSPLKTEYRNKEVTAPRVSNESGEMVSDGKPQVNEDPARKIEASKRGNETTSSHDSKYPIRSKSSQLGIASGIDETEFFALERLLSLFNNNDSKGRRGSDVQQLDECFDGDARPFADGAQNLNDTKEVFVRTSVGSYRFEGISREFTRKLYDWERHRGISPTSSTFRLLGPAYIPFLRQTTIETSPDSTTKDRSDEPILFKVSSLKRSKSVGSMVGKTVQNEFFARQSNVSLQSLNKLTNRLKNADCISALPESVDYQRTEDITDDIMDDSEPEAMIVDIEDVIEETASPLERVQPHQTPVYSVAASETTSIAVPLGTVTSSHEPSPVYLIEVEENSDSKHWESKKWNQRKSISSEDSLSMEQPETMKSWDNEKISSSNVDLNHWSPGSSSGKTATSDIKDNVDILDQKLDKDPTKSNSLTYSMEIGSEPNIKKEEKKIEDHYDANFKRVDIPVTSLEDDIERSMKEHLPDETNENKTIGEWNLGNRSIFDASIKETMFIYDVRVDFPRKCRKMKATMKEKSLSSEISFIIVQSKVATCRYNQKLSSEKTHAQGCDDEGMGKDENSNDGKDATGTTIKFDNEYEEVNLITSSTPCCSLTTIQTVPNYNEETKYLPQTSAACKLDKAKPITSDVGLIYTDREDKKVRKVKKNYSIIREESDDTSHDLPTMKLGQNYRESCKSCIEYLRYEKQRDRSKEITTNAQSGRNEYEEHRDSVSSSITCTENSYMRECRREPTIPTTAYKIAPCRDERCFNRIVINEETLNKIVVPTASTSCLENIKTSKPPVECTTENITIELRRRSSTDREVSTDRDASVKKQNSNSPTRNVFIRTKRIIFSPFRRSEEHSAGKKESSITDEDHVAPMKSKSKSRSGSPKMNRQDALLRMSLSLPWPLRSSSKDREMKETKVDVNDREQTSIEKQNFERCKSVESSRKSSTSDNNVFQTQIKQESRIFRDKNSSIELPTKDGAFSHSVERKNQRGNVSAQTIHNEQQNQASFRISLPSLKTEEKIKETTSTTKFDPQSSDLIHKLTILSNVVARRDGRTNTISEDTSLESHSLRVRRAKEDFLSRRGGPLCNSVLEPSSMKYEVSPRMFPHYYEQISENQEQTKEKCLPIVDHTNHALNSSHEIPNNLGVLKEVNKEENVKQFANEYNTNELSNNSVVSRPDRVKSASAGMINVDPDTFVRLTESSRGCESLPRSICKQQQPLGSFAKIVSKFKFARLIRGKDIQEENMSTISKLCRQSLLIDVRNDFEKWESNNREKITTVNNTDEIKKNG